jgi:AcrR family transcriptional regulator
VMRKKDGKRRAILENAYRLFRAQGFDGTSMADITSQVGGSKATLYSHFLSKEELFVECMMAALQNYMSDTLKHLDVSRSDPQNALRNFGASVLNFICSPEQVEVRRLMIAEAARSGTGKLFFDKITALRAQISSYLAACMTSGLLRRDDPDLAADHLGALLEAEVLEPLLLHVRDAAPNAEETAAAARRAVAAFLRAYAPTSPPIQIAAGPDGHLKRLPPHEL